jgi:hypothetical protein
LPENAKKLADEKNFDLQGYGIDAQSEQTRSKRLVRIGAIQNQIVLPTNASVQEQVFLLEEFIFGSFIYDFLYRLMQSISVLVNYYMLLIYVVLILLVSKKLGLCRLHFVLARSNRGVNLRSLHTMANLQSFFKSLQKNTIW